MEHMTDITVDDLQQALDSTDEKTPATRLVAAIAYKNEVTQSELSEWFDVERKTIYNWLTRLEKRDVDEAIRDEHRAGRPRKLSEEQLDELRESFKSRRLERASTHRRGRPSYSSGSFATNSKSITHDRVAVG